MIYHQFSCITVIIRNPSVLAQRESENMLLIKLCLPLLSMPLSVIAVTVVRAELVSCPGMKVPNANLNTTDLTSLYKTAVHVTCLPGFALDPLNCNNNSLDALCNRYGSWTPVYINCQRMTTLPSSQLCGKYIKYYILWCVIDNKFHFLGCCEKNCGRTENRRRSAYCIGTYSRTQFYLHIVLIQLQNNLVEIMLLCWKLVLFQAMEPSQEKERSNAAV